jgi:pimeloyl-ACP methyl ester carboxylesterase
MVVSSAGRTTSEGRSGVVRAKEGTRRIVSAPTALASALSDHYRLDRDTTPIKETVMKANLSVAALLLLCIGCAPQPSDQPVAAEQQSVQYGSNEQAGAYADVNGIRVYYEIYGEGEPLLLLHGNSGSIGNFLYQIPELSKHFKVIAVDSRAQGRSTDSDQEITYALMASDMSELIDKLNLGSVHVVGWSDGGNIGLELAFAHPEKVKKLVTFGANYTHENWMAPPDSIVMDANDPRLLKATPFLKRYVEERGKLSESVSKKLADLMENYPNLTEEQLRQISVPVLIVAGDHDVINPAQTMALFANLPHSQLFIVPGASHFVPIEQPELVNGEVVRFLSTPYRPISAYYWLSFFQ